MRREVEASALGRVISTVNVVDIGVLDGVSAEELERALTGNALTRTGRHGKQLFFRISKGGWLTVHLGMTGGLMFLEREEGPPQYSRVQFDFEDGGFARIRGHAQVRGHRTHGFKGIIPEAEETGTGRSDDREGGFCGPSKETSTPHQDGPVGPVGFGRRGQLVLGRGSVPMRSAPDGPGGRAGRGSVRLHPPEPGLGAEVLT